MVCAIVIRDPPQSSPASGVRQPGALIGQILEARPSHWLVNDDDDMTLHVGEVWISKEILLEI